MLSKEKKNSKNTPPKAKPRSPKKRSIPTPPEVTRIVTKLFGKSFDGSKSNCSSNSNSKSNCSSNSNKPGSQEFEFDLSTSHNASSHNSSDLRMSTNNISHSTPTKNDMA